MSSRVDKALCPGKVIGCVVYTKDLMGINAVVDEQQLVALPHCELGFVILK